MKMMNMISGTILAVLSFLWTSTALAEEKSVNTEEHSELSAEYNMEFIHLSSSQLNLVVEKKDSQCMYESGDDQFNLPIGKQHSVYLEDSNNFFSGCAFKTKSVEWKIFSGPISCHLIFEHGYDTDWYTEIKGCENIVDRASCKGEDCNQKKVYGGDSKIDIKLEISAS
ncbi:hypothetical protein [Xenorhabdus entomophaga]|uniref:hypothetical protein n=1 Tax=Xenorhabdus entomophaga TaxID=3136257 RepID=UPI0030F3B0D3